MPTFTYQAVDLKGQKASGQVEARSRSEVFGKLESRGLQLVSLSSSDVETVDGKSSVVPSGGLLLTRGQIILFTEELSDLLEAGLQLETALRAMERRRELNGLKEVVAALREKVVQGVSFSAALRSVSNSFGELYCNLVTAGEVSGSLPNILRRQAKHLQALDELQSRVVQALIYPSFIFGAGILLMTVFMSYLVPQLTRLLSETGKSMPLPTRMLIATSNFATHYGLFIVAFLLMAGFAFWMFIQKPQGRRWWDEQKLKIPLLGRVLAVRYYAQFSQTLANLVSNGIPLLNALRLMQSATSNLFFHSLLDGILVLVGEGRSFSKALQQAGHFPPLLIDMVAVGEQTGDMGMALEKVAVRYDRELSRSIQKLTSLIQPVIIVVMALLVGFVAYSMISGIFQTISGLRMR